AALGGAISIAGAGALSINLIVSNTNALVQGVNTSLTVTNHGGTKHVHVIALDTAEIKALAGAAAVGISIALLAAGAVSVGAAVAANTITQIVTATLANLALPTVNLVKADN